MNISIPTKMFCHPMCLLFVCSEGWSYMFGRLDWVGWGREGGGLGLVQKRATGDHALLVQSECIVRHLITSQF